MQFAVNDKVIHPRHGPGIITGMQHRGMGSEASSYYIIEIPAQRLMVYVPSQLMEQLGVRPIMALAKIPGILAMLRSAPHLLPQNFQERQQGIWLKLGTGLTIELAEVVRDLSWHRRRGRLTLKDSAYLNQGRDRLAAEMAMASDGKVSEANRAIDAALTAGMEDETNQEERPE